MKVIELLIFYIILKKYVYYNFSQNYLNKKIINFNKYRHQFHSFNYFYNNK